MTTTENIIIIRATGGRETVLKITSTDGTRVEAVGLEDSSKSLWELLNDQTIESIWWAISDGSVASLIDIVNSSSNEMKLDCQFGEEAAQYDAQRNRLDGLRVKVERGDGLFVTTAD